MKTSELDKARGLQRRAVFYRKLLDMLNDYPGYEANLVVNGEELMISRDEARNIVAGYQDKNAAEMTALGLEFDE